MKSAPILLEQVDQRTWNRLDEVDTLFEAGKDEKGRTMLLNLTEDISATLHPIHPAVLVRILRTSVRQDPDFVQSVALKVMEKCSLTDTYPSLEVSDILISAGNLELARFILDRHSAVSDTAFLEYEKGRLAAAEGDAEEAREAFLRSYNTDPMFMPVYDPLIRMHPGDEAWTVRKNIALLMAGRQTDIQCKAFPGSSPEALYKIYWEWYKGDRTAAKNMLDVSVGGDNGPEFRLAAGRMYLLLKDPETAVRFFRTVHEEMPDSDFVRTEFANALIMSGRSEEAMVVLDEVERKDPLNRGMMECKMKALSVLGKKADLKEYAAAFMNTEHADRDGYVFTARVLSECGETSEASRIIDILISQISDDPSLFILRSSNEMRADRYTAALASADEAVRLSARDPDSRYQRARILADMGRMKKAMRDIEAALSTVRTYVPALILLKDIHLGQKSYREALNVCNDILLIEPHNSDVIKDKAYTLDRLGRKDESLAEYRNALRIRNNEKLFEEVLTLLVRTERYDELYGLFNEFSGEYVRNPMMWRLKGNAEYSSGDYQEALESFSKAADLSPYEPRIWHSRGMAAEMAGQLKKAEESFDKALLMDLDNTEYWLSKAVVQEKRGNLKGAVLALNRVISESPESMFALVRKAMILIRLGRYEEGMFFIDLALRINSKDVAVHEMKREVLKHISDPQQVIRASDDILLVDPCNASALRDKAAAQLSLGLFADTVSTVDTALEAGPSLDLLLMKKEALKGIRDHEGMASVCTEILRHVPEDRNTRMDLADALAESGDTAAAMEIYDALQAEDPMDVRVTVMKAKVRSHAGEGSEAVALFQEVMENKPDDPDTLNVLAEIMVEQGLREEAVRVLDRAIGMDPEDTRSYRSKASILLSEGDPDRALETLREALRRDPGDPRTWKAVGEVQEAKGELRQALMSYDSAMKMGMDGPDMYAARGRVQETLGMDEAAINSYSLASVKDPEDTASRISVAAIQIKLNRLSAAEQNLDSVLSQKDDPLAMYHRARIHVIKGREKDARDLYQRYRRYGREDELSRRFRELVGETAASCGTGGREFRDDVEMHSHKVLEFCYNTGHAIRDDVTFRETGVPEDMRQRVLEYLGGIEEYGELDLSSEDFARMESLSRDLIINERMANIDSEPLVSLSSAYMASGSCDIEEAKRLVAYIYKVMTEDIEQDVYPEGVVGVAEEISQTAGDMTTFSVMESFDVGVCCARMSKMLSGRMSDSISFHI